MRKTFVKTLMGYVDNPKFMFLTGDLGYNALEPLRDRMGKRFINAGVAEQNMVTVAAGLASMGDRPWVYSIAPFLYARAFEQIRNDVCQAKMPVMIVGNGAGYQYGVMGPSHHALNDYGVLLTLPHIKCYMPAFASDIAPIVEEMMVSEVPCYLRLGIAEEPRERENWLSVDYKPWRLWCSHPTGPIVIILGSIAGSLVLPLTGFATVWVVTELPGSIPSEFFNTLNSHSVIVIEEHVPQGGLGDSFCSCLVRQGKDVSRFTYKHVYADGYPSGTYGSKEFHRKQCGLDKDSILKLVKEL